MNDNLQDILGPSDERGRRVMRVRTADVKIARTPWVLETLAIGSCVAICLYDRVQRLGALCHSLLPGRTGKNDGKSAKFTAEAIELMVEGLEREKSLLANIEAKLVGGASIFACLEANDELRMGDKNVKAARDGLQRLGIPVVAEDVGGLHGRSVAFSTENGLVTVRSAQGSQNVL